MANVIGDVHGGGAETTDGIGDVEIDLSRVGLHRDVILLWESGLSAKNLVEFVDLSAVSMKYLEKRGLGLNLSSGHSSHMKQTRGGMGEAELTACGTCGTSE